MEIQAVRLDTTTGDKTVHLFLDEEWECHCLSKDSHSIIESDRIIDGYDDEAQSTISIDEYDIDIVDGLCIAYEYEDFH